MVQADILSTFTYDFWQQEPLGNKVEVTCCMPNFVTIDFETSRTATLLEIKEELFYKAVNEFPLSHLLRDDASTYMFTCVSVKEGPLELRDETKRLCDIEPLGVSFKIIDLPDVEDNEKEINLKIRSLLGKGSYEYNAMKIAEVKDFRGRMKVLGLEVARARQKKSWWEKLEYHFPPRLALTAAISPSSKEPLPQHFLILVFDPNSNRNFTLKAYHHQLPKDLVVMALNKRATTQKKKEKPDNFVMKVCGQQEYLLGEKPLIQFLYIQECMSRGTTPSFALTSIDSVPEHEEDIYENMDIDMRSRSFSTLSTRQTCCASTIDDLFSFKVEAVNRLNTDQNRTVEIGVQAGLFHGGKPLCESLRTSEKPVKEGNAEMVEELQFDIQVRNIPRMARICLAVYEVSKTAKGVKARKLKDTYMNPLAWVNTTVYDFKSQLNCGKVTLHMWTFAEDYQSEDLLQNLGTVTVNNNVEHSTFLTLEFPRYRGENIAVYPSLNAIVQYAEQHVDPSLDAPPSQEMLDHLKELRKMVDSDPLCDMHEQDMKEMWRLRYYILDSAPTLLPKLLESVEWSDHKQVAEAISLVQKWPVLSLEKALELLDYAYAEQEVRSYAVRCLHKVPDQQLSLYLLQLVQAIKHESYLACDLVEFLLKRALNNRTIGHFLFWHLRSEMSFPYVSVRFGLILEAYCRGSVEHMSLLSKQLHYLEKLKETSEALRQRRDRDKARQWMQEQLQEPHSAALLQDVVNPLDPRFKFSSVRVDKCRVMDSKMRPLYIVMENYDPLGEDVYIIFKNGDDLRQDMLALQMIRIMDMLWKNEGFDYRMNPYGCVSTDHRVGLIEVVLNAETIANIQKEKGMFTATSAFNKGSLLAWLKDHNQEEKQLMKAVEEFTLSCAGYCVATYVLGVADRHSDNIMVKRSGQLFHIDFGHILGHFKEKFGFRRERVPFVLTHDFVHVINKGQKDKKEALEFQIFQEHCEKAYMILRKHGGLILSLFAMMISTGLPELSSEKDLNYLRDTLQLDNTDAGALIHFQGKLTEALANSWKTSLNWASHNLAKNNKT